MTLGEKIHALRKQNNMSQEHLAEKIMVTRQAISKWELSESIPDINNIIQLSELFNVTTDYLLKNGAYTTPEAPEPPPEAPPKPAKHPRKKVYWDAMLAVGILGVVFSSIAGFLRNQHANVLFPIAGVAVMLSIIVAFTLMLKPHAPTINLRIGGIATNVGILTIMPAGIPGLFRFHQANTILSYASIMAWIGIAVTALWIVSQFINIKSLLSKRPKPDDMLTNVLKSTEEQPGQNG